MLEVVRRGAVRVKNGQPKDRQKLSEAENGANGTEEANRTQWTVKGIDRQTLELSRKAARRRGMKFGAWVDQVLRAAATEEGEPSTNVPTRELMNKIAE